jgi:hypothetical protein
VKSPLGRRARPPDAGPRARASLQPAGAGRARRTTSTWRRSTSCRRCWRTIRARC